jgi:23S rRNA pseudouridine1911/1915/1917 synthase
MKWIVPPEWEGERADRVLAQLSGASRAAARAAIDAQTVNLDGQAVAARTRVHAAAVFEGEVGDLRVPLAAERVSFGVAYEDRDVAVVDKPAGIVTHPGAGRTGGTLAAGLLERWPHIRGVGAEDRWGIVHRLDKDTSGLLAVALTPTAFEGLSEEIRRRAVTREYLAIVVGRLDVPTGTIDAPIMRDPNRPTRMRVHPEGRPSVTHYKVIEDLGGRVLLRVTLETGRTHQIRVHLASIGVAVAGDRVYGNGRGSSRLFLHAARLAFDHPCGGDRIDVSSDLPDDLAAVLSAARSGR